MNYGNTNRRKPLGVSARNILFNQYKSRARRTGKSWGLSQEEFVLITSSSCTYCGVEPSQTFLPNRNTHGAYVYNGIDRRDNRRGYEPDNSVACCYTCNVAKATMTVEQFVSWIRRVYEKIVA